jgi:hypothetical protein
MDYVARLIRNPSMERSLEDGWEGVKDRGEGGDVSFSV